MVDGFILEGFGDSGRLDVDLVTPDLLRDWSSLDDDFRDKLELYFRDVLDFGKERVTVLNERDTLSVRDLIVKVLKHPHNSFYLDALLVWLNSGFPNYVEAIRKEMSNMSKEWVSHNEDVYTRVGRMVVGVDSLVNELLALRERVRELEVELAVKKDVVVGGVESEIASDDFIVKGGVDKDGGERSYV